MSILVLEPVGGIAGDMMIGALLHLGAPRAALDEGLRRLALPGVSVDASEVEITGIRAIHVDVRAPQDRQRAGVADGGRVAADDERLRPLLLGCSRGVGVFDRSDDGDAVALGDGVAESALRHPCVGSVSSAQRPIGCQTVFSSRKAAICQGLCESALPWTTRLTFSAASCSSSGASPSAPETSSALTSM